MNVVALKRFIEFFTLIVSGLGLEILFSKAFYKLTNNPYKTHHFSFGKYIYFLLFPFIIILVYLKGNNLDLLGIFVTFSLLGTLSEWLIGFFYHSIVGQRLWTYHRYPITKYTSLLSIPMWGIAGLIFYLFMQIFL